MALLSSFQYQVCDANQGKISVHQSVDVGESNGGHYDSTTLFMDGHALH